MVIVEQHKNDLFQFMNNQDIYCIGIDLGTSTSSVAILKNGVYEVILDGDRSSSIDSIVTFGPNIQAVGVAMKGELSRSRMTVYETKRLIGRKYHQVQEEIARNQWAYEVICDNKDNAVIRLAFGSKEAEEIRIVTPEEVWSLILSYLKDKAEKRMGVGSISSCVITCPVQFTSEQRKSTTSSAILAGFTQCHLIAEPTAAAIAFCEKYDSSPTKPRHYIVYDFGGGTFDASVVYRDGKQFKVINTAGDSFLGGKDIDVAIMETISQRIKLLGYQLNPKKKLQFKMACKEAKESLLTAEMAEISLDFCKWPNEEYDIPTMSITKPQLEFIAKPIISRTINIVTSVLTTCSPSLTFEDIDYIFLMGGSSKLSLITNELKNYFRSDQIISDIYDLPFSGIALGATIIANKNEIQTLSMIDLTKQINTSSLISLIDVSPYEIRVICGVKRIVILHEKTQIGKKQSILVIPAIAEKEYTRISITAGTDESIEGDIIIGTMRIPIDKDRCCEEQPLTVTVFVTSDDHVDVTVLNELSRHAYHTIMNIGLNDKQFSDLQVLRESSAFVKLGMDQRQELKKDIGVLCDQCRLKLQGKHVEIQIEIEELNEKALNAKLSIEALSGIKTRIVAILSRISFVC